MTRRIGSIAVLLQLVLSAAAPAQEAGVRKTEVLDLSRRIDVYFARRSREAGVEQAGRAEDAVYFRRLHLDLGGRIPSLLEGRDFLDNSSPDKRWEWTERLLASPAYSGHMAAVWRNLILGNTTNVQAQFLAPGFEAWLKDRFQKDAGLDAITRDILNTQNAVARFNQVQFGNPQVNNPLAFLQVNEFKPENLAGATSRIFLGVKLECAQCHAHPFASWTREQFWEFAAFFGNNQFAPRPNGSTPVQVGREILIPNTTKKVRAKFLTGEEPKWADSANPRQVVADWVTARANPYFARAMVDHVWTYLMGASLLEPIQEAGKDERITHPELLDDLARAFVAHNYDMKFLIRAIVHSESYGRSSAGKSTPRHYELFAIMPIRALSPEQLYDSVAEATELRDPNSSAMPQPFAFNVPQGPRAQFLTKFQGQPLGQEPQTSILQALYLMNGKFLADRTRVENNTALQVLARQSTSHARRIETLYLMVLARPPRPEETVRLESYLARSQDLGQGLSDVYWALLNSGEFMLNH